MASVIFVSSKGTILLSRFLTCRTRFAASLLPLSPSFLLVIVPVSPRYFGCGPRPDFRRCSRVKGLSGLLGDSQPVPLGGIDLDLTRNETRLYKGNQLVDELGNVLEVAIHGGEPDKSDVVDLLESLADLLPYDFRAHLAFVLFVNLGFDLGGNALELVERGVPLVTGLDHPREDLLPAEELPARVLLDHHPRSRFGALVGREALPAGQALAAPPNGISFADRA